MEIPVGNEGRDNKRSLFDAGNEADESVRNFEVECSRDSIPQQDSLLLEHILEEEIWLVVLDKLVRYNPVAATNCANATPYFWELLQKKRTQFLFPKVIEILALRNEEKENYWDSNNNVILEENEEDQEENGDEQKIPKDYEVWRKTVLDCRFVCRAWNKGIEKCYQKTEMSGIPELMTDPDPRTRLKTHDIGLSYNWTNIHYRIADFGDAQKFLDHFTESHFFGDAASSPRNPFFRRFMSLSRVNTTGQDTTACIAAITKILEMWGQEIWYCYLPLNRKFDKAPQHYCQLAQWLGLMPNLKYLKLFDVQCTCEMTAEFFNRNPIPTLGRLEALDMTFVGTPIVNQLLHKNKHIYLLKIDGINVICEDVIRSLTNIKRFCTSDSELGDKVVEEHGGKWKLNKLTYDAQMDSMKGHYLFQCLQTNWSSTLTQLELLRDPFSTEMDTRLEESKSLRLDLPHLRSLTLQIEGTFFLDFILPSKNSLEHLIINQNRVEDVSAEFGEREQIIEYVGFEDKLLESNIWKLFPKLKTLFRNESLYSGLIV